MTNKQLIAATLISLLPVAHAAAQCASKPSPLNLACPAPGPGATVVTPGMDLQAAINATPSGGDVLVTGISVYNGSLVINKPVNIHGVHTHGVHDQTIVTDTTGIGIDVNSRGVCIQNLRIDHRSSSAAIEATSDAVQLYGNFIILENAPSPSIAVRLLNAWNSVVVGNIMVGDGHEAGVDLQSLTGAFQTNTLVGQNTISGFAFGVRLGGSDDTDGNYIFLNDIRSCLWGIHASPGEGGTMEQNQYNANRIHGESIGIGIQLTGTSDARVCYNHISGVGGGINLSPGVVTATDTYIGFSEIMATSYGINVATTGNTFQSNVISTEDTGGTAGTRGLRLADAAPGEQLIVGGTFFEHDCAIQLPLGAGLGPIIGTSPDFAFNTALVCFSTP